LKAKPDEGIIQALMIKYKIVEINVVTDEVIEKVVNEWVTKGWVFDQIQFAMRDASKRPAMAFIFFIQESSNAPESEE
jgi:hypothetical protein